MIRVAMAMLIGVSVGLAVVYWRAMGGEPIGAVSAATDRESIERRLSDIETSLALERIARQALANDLGRLEILAAALSARATEDTRLSSDSPARLASDSVSDGSSTPRASGSPMPLPDDLPQVPQVLDQFIRQQQFDRFISAGLAAGQAQAILQREEEIEMEALRARHAAAQSGATPQDVASITPLALLRSELGDADYAKYLDARGRPTSILVREVMKGSPAEIAGLKPGDEILSYDGQRVFDANELIALAYAGKAGTTIPLQVLRDGQSIPIYVEAGPIGINGAGRSAGF